MTTFMQVFSRVWVILIVFAAPAVQPTWYCGMMALSWSLVEVPRYAFYVATLLGSGDVKGTPYPLFWLRYSLFAVLYPSGITGEILSMHAGLYESALTAYTLGPLAIGSILPFLMKVVF